MTGESPAGGMKGRSLWPVSRDGGVCGVHVEGIAVGGRDPELQAGLADVAQGGRALDDGEAVS